MRRGSRVRRGLRSAGSYNRARGLRAGGATGERHQRDVAGALDGDAEPTLMARADSGHAARKNLAALLYELREDVGALVVDEVHLLDAKLADFFLAEVLALAAARSTGTATRAAGTAFTTGTAVTTTWTAVAASGSVPAAFATRRGARSLCLFLLVCHNCLPFPFHSDEAEVDQEFLNENAATLGGRYKSV